MTWIGYRDAFMSGAIVASAIAPLRPHLRRWYAMAADIPELIVPDAATWRRWLGEHHASRDGVWLVLARKGVVERAQADGRWEAAYGGASSSAVPPDLAAALRAQPRAQAMFDILTSQNRYAILFRISGAKQVATRARRIEQFVTMLAHGETVYPQKRAL